MVPGASKLQEGSNCSRTSFGFGHVLGLGRVGTDSTWADAAWTNPTIRMGILYCLALTRLVQLGSVQLKAETVIRARVYSKDSGIER